MAAVSSGFPDLWGGSHPAAGLAKLEAWLSVSSFQSMYGNLSHGKTVGWAVFPAPSVLSSVESALHAMRTAFCWL